MVDETVKGDHFVQGIVVVEDEAYILEPDVRLADGRKVHILYSDLRSREERKENEDDPLSVQLEVDQWYEMLLLVQIGLGKDKHITYLPGMPPDTRLELVSTDIQGHSGVTKYYDVVQGIILDLDWNAASQHYVAMAGSVIYKRRFVLIETAIGKMVLNYKALQERLGERVAELAEGGYLTWERSRVDLLAIIQRRDPSPGE